MFLCVLREICRYCLTKILFFHIASKDFYKIMSILLKKYKQKFFSCEKGQRKAKGTGFFVIIIYTVRISLCRVGNKGVPL